MGAMEWGHENKPTDMHCQRRFIQAPPATRARLIIGAVPQLSSNDHVERLIARCPVSACTFVFVFRRAAKLISR
jgi:hypothetical protein